MVTAFVGPDFSLFLLLAGFLFIYVEFLRPGVILAGVAGSSLAIFGANSLAAEHLRWEAAIIGFAGFVLLVLEAMRPSRFLLTALGIFTMIAAAMLLRIHPASAAVMLSPFALISQFLFATAIRARRNKIS